MTHPDPNRFPPSIPTPVAVPGHPPQAAQPPMARPIAVQPVRPQAVPAPAYPAQAYPAQAYPAQAYPAQQPVPAQQPSPVYPQPYAAPTNQHPHVPQQPGAPFVPQYPQQQYPAQQYPAQPQQPYPAQPATAYAQPQPIAPNQPAFPAAPATPARPVPAARPVPIAATPNNAAPWQQAPAARPMPVSAANPQSLNRPVPVAVSTGAVRTESPDDEENQPAVADQAVRSAPPWLVSLVVHMIFLILLGLMYLPNLFDSAIQLDVVIAETEGEQLIDDTLEMMSLETIDITEPVLSEAMVAVDDPFAAPPEIPDLVLDATTSSSDIAAPSIGLALTGRDPGMKKALLAAYGGTATTEEAVKRGLEWLKRNQQKDGMWSLSGPYSSGSNIENPEAATAMALLAFQGAGHTHRTGEHKNVVAKGWEALIKSQDKDGNFFREGAHHHRLYTQAQCTIAICELYGMTRDEKYQKPAQLALDYAIKAQSPLGGWRYDPRQDSDTSVTGWFVMALQSGRMAGLAVPSPELDNINKFLDSVTPDGGIRYSYKPGEGTTPTMTAEGLLCRQYLGWKHDDPRLIEGINYVNSQPINYADMNVYYWYYATQATHHMEGEYWDKWNRVMRQVVPEQQIKTGAEAGSWAPSDDRWGAHGGRLYTTCLSIYMLEVYYRHLPIYKYRVN